ncbi:MAG: hypothetical protein P1U89_19325 [Verrucomicrobiales bacterium]|nr:hypothetical protein [Verrucomicrobiales bacterium]
MKYVLKAIIFTAAIFVTASIASAQTPEEKARALMEKYKPTLVVLTVKGKIVTTTTGDPLPPREQQRRTLGITVGDNGLIAVSNSAIDSAVGLAGQKAQIEDSVVTIQSAKTEFSDIEISYGDATILHGKVVRQDVNADIAFILPDPAEAKALKKKFEKVDLSQFAATADAADQVVGLSRSSSVFGYMPTLIMGRITGVFKGDRTYFVNTAGNSQGMPIFTLDGRPVGITVVRIVDGQPTGILATLSAGSIQVMANLANG